MYILLIQQPQPWFLGNRRGWFAALILINHMNDKLPICNNLLHYKWPVICIWFLTLQYLEKKLKVKKKQKKQTNMVSVCIKVHINRKSDFDPLLSGIQSSITYGE